MWLLFPGSPALPGLLHSWTGSWPRSIGAAHASTKRAWVQPPIEAIYSLCTGRELCCGQLLFAVMCMRLHARACIWSSWKILMPRPAQALSADPIQESGQMARDRQSVRDEFIIYSGVKRRQDDLVYLVVCTAAACPAITAKSLSEGPCTHRQFVGPSLPLPQTNLWSLTHWLTKNLQSYISQC